MPSPHMFLPSDAILFPFSPFNSLGQLTHEPDH
jgi:hypothetical protein